MPMHAAAPPRGRRPARRALRVFKKIKVSVSGGGASRSAIGSPARQPWLRLLNRFLSSHTLVIFVSEHRDGQSGGSTARRQTVGAASAEAKGGVCDLLLQNLPNIISIHVYICWERLRTMDDIQHHVLLSPVT